MACAVPVNARNGYSSAAAVRKARFMHAERAAAATIGEQYNPGLYESRLHKTLMLPAKYERDNRAINKDLTYREFHDAELSNLLVKYTRVLLFIQSKNSRVLSIT